MAYSDKAETLTDKLGDFVHSLHKTKSGANGKANGKGNGADHGFAATASPPGDGGERYRLRKLQDPATELPERPRALIYGDPANGVAPDPVLSRLFLEGAHPDFPTVVPYSDRSGVAIEAALFLLLKGCSKLDTAVTVESLPFGEVRRPNPDGTPKFKTDELAERAVTRTVNAAVRLIAKRRADEERGRRLANPAQWREGQDPSQKDMGDVAAEQMSGRFLYVDGEWWHFDDVRWQDGGDGAARAEVARIVAAIALVAHPGPTAKAVDKRCQLKTSNSIAGTQRLAGVTKRLRTKGGIFDVDRWILNTPGGVVNLLTGELGPHDSGLLCSKVTSVTPARAGTPCPLWRTILARCFLHAPEIVPYLKRLFGYALTGSSAENVFPFGNGSGGNGKTLIVGTVVGVMGDYATTMEHDLLLATYGTKHTTGQAALEGVRFAIGSEIGHGRSWDEATLKRLTGGDRITARKMHQNNRTFDNQLTLFVIGNKKPAFKGVDAAIRRRLHLIDFAQNIPPEERDPKLGEKLKQEYPAILRWMIEGAVEWNNVGLQPPACVLTAAEEYMNENDFIKQWVEDCCIIDPKVGPTLFPELRKSWKNWCQVNDLDKQADWTPQNFGEALSPLHLTKKVSNSKLWYCGIALKATSNTATYAVSAAVDANLSPDELFEVPDLGAPVEALENSIETRKQKIERLLEINRLLEEEAKKRNGDVINGCRLLDQDKKP